jgi:hypothetical protein
LDGFNPSGFGRRIFKQDIGNLWSLKVTRTRFYKSVSFMMSEDHIYNSHEDESITASKYLRQQNENLMTMLRDLKSRKKSWSSPFVVFSRSIFEDMALNI